MVAILFLIFSYVIGGILIRSYNTSKNVTPLDSGLTIVILLVSPIWSYIVLILIALEKLARLLGARSA